MERQEPDGREGTQNTNPEFRIPKKNTGDRIQERYPVFSIQEEFGRSQNPRIETSNPFWNLEATF